MVFSFLWKARIMPVDNPQFMNKSSSDTLKGLCAMVVVMVHFPEAYQNTLQDAIGSFAYIAVTLFFMVSSYGMMLSAERKKSYLGLRHAMEPI